MMTRKHFEEVAQILSDREANDHPYAVIERKAIANDLADMFARENPRFDLEKFLTAAGVN